MWDSDEGQRASVIIRRLHLKSQKSEFKVISSNSDDTKSLSIMCLCGIEKMEKWQNEEKK